jgi:hypothetical protein
MKRFIVALMTVAFVSTVAMADTATPVATPAAAPMKAKKHHHKKAMATPAAATTTPSK